MGLREKGNSVKDGQEEPRPQESRLHPRAVVRLPAKILLQGATEWKDVLVHNLSAGGAAVHAPFLVPTRSEVHLRFQLPASDLKEDALVDVAALVVHTGPIGAGASGPFLAGLHFLTLGSRDFNHVSRFVWAVLNGE